MEQRISGIDFASPTAGRAYYPSPAAWEDEVLYVIAVDRFSDGRETNYLDNFGNLVLTGETPLYHATDRGNATMTDAGRQRWLEAGESRCGGTLNGLERRVGYLERLGITAICVSPVFTPDSLDIDSRFGTSDDFVSMVRTAHQHGIRVILEGIVSCDAIQHWIRVADIDGVRASHETLIREFAQSIGKENFYTGTYEAQEKRQGSLAALAFLATTQGAPCIRYGSEQLFDGIGATMFGGEFGAFESRGRHFFDETAFVYRELSKILQLRRRSLVIRRGRQYLREISGDGVNFGLPRALGGVMRSIVPWSRIFNGQEVLLAMNTDVESSRTAWVTVDANLQAARTHLTYRYSTDTSQIGIGTAIESRNGRAVQVTLPPAGFAILS